MSLAVDTTTVFVGIQYCRAAFRRASLSGLIDLKRYQPIARAVVFYFDFFLFCQNSLVTVKVVLLEFDLF